MLVPVKKRKWYEKIYEFCEKVAKKIHKKSQKEIPFGFSVVTLFIFLKIFLFCDILYKSKNYQES